MYSSMMLRIILLLSSPSSLLLYPSLFPSWGVELVTFRDRLPPICRTRFQTRLAHRQTDDVQNPQLKYAAQLCQPSWIAYQLLLCYFGSTHLTPLWCRLGRRRSTRNSARVNDLEKPSGKVGIWPGGNYHIGCISCAAIRRCCCSIFWWRRREPQPAQHSTHALLWLLL